MADADARRGGGKWLRQAKTIGLLVLIVLVVIVVLKNGQPTKFWFFGWDLQMPLALMLLVTFLLGGLAGAGGYMLKLKKK
jgi:uncharacterized integral membrane protein